MPSPGASPYLLRQLADCPVGVIEMVEAEIAGAYNAGYADGGRGKITMDQARSLAATYDGGEGHHPLARHRDSMG